jgi:hypothetical protein
VIDPELGYDPEDQFYYNRRLVAELVPMALAGPEPPATGLTDRPGGGGDAAEGGNMLAMILDVRSALMRMNAGNYYGLRRCALGGEELPAYALDEIVELLGGVRGHGD